MVYNSYLQAAHTALGLATILTLSNHFSLIHAWEIPNNSSLHRNLFCSFIL